MEKAVFSYWATTEDILKSATNWYNPKFHLYSWVLAVFQAKKFFKKVELVTDSQSAKFFVDVLKLPFDTVVNAMDDISNYDKGFWALGKIKAYEIQKEPFVHLDNDCILYNGLPKNMLNAGLLAQNREAYDWFKNVYTGEIEHINKYANFVPTSWGKADEAVCMGIYGCRDLDFNVEYCKQAFQLIDNNKGFWEGITNKGCYCVVFEQYLAACVAKEMRKEFVFLSDPFCKTYLESIGYIHIWGGKKMKEWFEPVQKIVQNDFPNHKKIIESL